MYRLQYSTVYGFVYLTFRVWKSAASTFYYASGRDATAKTIAARWNERWSEKRRTTQSFVMIFENSSIFSDSLK